MKFGKINRRGAEAQRKKRNKLLLIKKHNSANLCETLSVLCGYKESSTAEAQKKREIKRFNKKQLSETLSVLCG